MSILLQGSGILELLRMDYSAYVRHHCLDKMKAGERLWTLSLRSTFGVVALYRLSGGNLPVVKHGFRLGYKIARAISGIQIPWSTRIGGGLLLPHYGNIVVNRWAVIGQDCTLLHNVTIGVKGRGADPGAPTLGHQVYLGAGACVLGQVHLGDGCVVGANSVVTRDVQPGAIVAGNPARAIGRPSSPPPVHVLRPDQGGKQAHLA